VLMEARLPQGKELLIRISPLSVEQGELHGMIVLLADVSLLKESERKRSEALHFLSHDLRSPITSLLSLIQLSHQENSPFGPAETTQRMEHYAKKALQLAEDFLQLARAENADRANFRETDFVTIAHNAMDEVYTEAQSRRIRLIRRIGVDEAWIKADAGMLERALVNLLHNAIRYSHEDSSVELSLKANEKEIECCVEDHGKGISDGDLRKIFKPFHRVQDSNPRQEGGTGLGLAFVKTVALKHRGSIDVESRRGTGSRFCLKIPCRNRRESNQDLSR
jgi:signal transduction histidine kinase